MTPDHDAPDSPVQTILSLYAQGFFPMADPLDDTLTQLHRPAMRAVLPLSDLHIPRKLRKDLASHPFEVRIDTAFDDVVAGCTEKRAGQWINEDIRTIFSLLHQSGHAHSLECWHKGEHGDELAGGIYGLAMGGAFCAESMFSRVPGASKIALVHLCALLDRAGFSLLDCQILNDHTQRFGAYEIPDEEYRNRLSAALEQPDRFGLCKNPPEPAEDIVLAYLNRPKSNKKAG